MAGQRANLPAQLAAAKSNRPHVTPRNPKKVARFFCALKKTRNIVTTSGLNVPLLTNSFPIITYNIAELN